MSSVQLNLYKNGNVCTPGERITGTVECFANTAKTISAIKVVFKGTGKTGWTERESYYDYQHRLQHTNVMYSSKENYFFREITLVQGITELSPGSHSYAFAFILPPSGLPSSYEGTYGNIRYHIKATVVRSWNTNLVHKIPLELFAPLNLNYSPYLRNPITTSVDKTMWSCLCNDKNILVFNMSLPVTGFVPGQDINIGAHVQNLTRVNVANVQFKIVQHLEFLTRNPRTNAKHMKNIIATHTEGGIGAHGEKSWTSTVRVPTRKGYPNFESCTIMKASYRLKATLIVPGPHRNLENEIDLVIGGIPLIGVSTSFTGGPPPAIPTVHTTSEQQMEEPTASGNVDNFEEPPLYKDVHHDKY
ncbi:hypothetical protein ILUMI_11363 [Ignelater luminosus]|uniref:Arrestin C-terminal-like domain-containing protein n=1 Tax=Ignelater luminosus TaxID=2038154 RepID=A0A8K0GDB1_IGNLU|nr:hypothetical protein ILUMI_11363 [Ignelater luminosus]